MFKKKEKAVNFDEDKAKYKRERTLLAISLIATTIFIWNNNIIMYKDLLQAKNDAIVIYNTAKNAREIRETNANLNEIKKNYQTDDKQEEVSQNATESVVEMSAYTSRVEETDDSPCVSADGTNICEYDGCIVASNDYKLGTKIEVEGFGICEVRDRMNRRYTGTGNMDIYFRMDLEGALNFGRRNINIKVIS